MGSVVSPQQLVHHAQLLRNLRTTSPLALLHLQRSSRTLT